MSTNLPPLELLSDRTGPPVIDDSVIRRRAQRIVDTLEDFGVPAEVVQVTKGPTVTRYYLKPGLIEHRRSAGTIRRKRVKFSAFTSLADDLALVLASGDIRVQAPVLGKPWVGIEVPNDVRGLVTLREILASETSKSSSKLLSLPLGRDIVGYPRFFDLAKLCQLLVAGSSDSDVSMYIDSLLLTLLLHLPPQKLRLLLLDSKKVELIAYRGIPHLIAPPSTDSREIIGTLAWLASKKDSRYQTFSNCGARNLAAYNVKAKANNGTILPYVVVIITELANLMMASKEVEHYVTTLAQTARVTGIYPIVATRRPMAEILTDPIKSHFTTRVAFTVSAKEESRVILDTTGAESLLGKGDMLYMAPNSRQLDRIQACHVTETEIGAIVKWWRQNQGKEIEYSGDMTGSIPWEKFVEKHEIMEQDELFPDAVKLLKEYRWISTSFLQRKLRIGYNRAARIMDLLVDRGLLGEPDKNHHGRRPVLSYKSGDGDVEERS